MTRHHALLALSVLVLVATSCYRGGTNVDAPGEGDRAPTFTLPSASGEQVELSDLAGEKPALLYFSMGPG